MCQGCFDEHWEDSLVRPSQWMSMQTPERLEAMRECGQLLVAESGCPPGPGYWQGGNLHAAVDDDNYDCEAYYTDEERAAPDFAMTPAEVAWAGLSEDERSIVVALLAGYDIP
jgi:predicted Fe-S protein YdhL (DUF1289 family)